MVASANVQARDIRRRLLEREGFEVWVRTSGAEVLSQAAVCDLLVLDGSLIDGLDLCRTLKSSPATASLPVLQLSGSLAEPRVAARALDGGADGFLVEPVDPLVLLAYVRALLRARRSEEHMRKASRMEALGRLAGGVAHDFNNLLTAIIAYADLGIRGATDPVLRDDLGQILSAAHRASALTRQLLTFGAQQRSRPEALDLAATTTDLLGMLDRVLGGDIAITCSSEPDLPAVVADRSLIEQVLMNLCVNARDAMPQGGALSLTLDHVVFEVAPSLSARPAGSWVRLVVADTGAGMDAATLAQVFEPFFTTKGRGTGLGLATVYGIVKQAGGHVRVSSTPGTGTQFEVLLPSHDGSLHDHPGEQGAAPGGARETVLLVEDEPKLRQVLSTVLSRAQYRVLEAGSVEQALEVLERERSPPALILTDVVLPGGTGVDLARRLANRIGPGAPTQLLFMSGYSDDRTGLREWLEQGSPFLAKPFTPDQLLTAVRAALGG